MELFLTLFGTALFLFSFVVWRQRSSALSVFHTSKQAGNHMAGDPANGKDSALISSGASETIIDDQNGQARSVLFSTWTSNQDQLNDAAG